MAASGGAQKNYQGNPTALQRIANRLGVDVDELKSAIVDACGHQKNKEFVVLSVRRPRPR